MLPVGIGKYGIDWSDGLCDYRRFLLEWLSFLYRYVPVGLLEVVPQHIQWHVPPFFERSDLETLLASDRAQDWVKISEMLLGPAPPGFSFTPKHKSHAYVMNEPGDMAGKTLEQENG